MSLEEIFGGITLLVRYEVIYFFFIYLPNFANNLPLSLSFFLTLLSSTVIKKSSIYHIIILILREGALLRQKTHSKFSHRRVNSIIIIITPPHIGYISRFNKISVACLERLLRGESYCFRLIRIVCTYFMYKL